MGRYLSFVHAPIRFIGQLLIYLPIHCPRQAAPLSQIYVSLLTACSGASLGRTVMYRTIQGWAGLVGMACTLPSLCHPPSSSKECRYDHSCCNFCCRMAYLFLLSYSTGNWLILARHLPLWRDRPRDVDSCSFKHILLHIE
jgi:hypothetical protein